MYSKYRFNIENFFEGPILNSDTLIKAWLGEEQDVQRHIREIE